MSPISGLVKRKRPLPTAPKPPEIRGVSNVLKQMNACGCDGSSTTGLGRGSLPAPPGTTLQQRQPASPHQLTGGPPPTACSGKRWQR